MHSPSTPPHGFDDWAEVLPLLASTRRVVTLDLPGYGLSGKPADGDYSLFRRADVVEAVLATHDITQCSLVAHDMGDLLPKLIRYIEERREHQDRWTAALVDHPGRLSVAWGEKDPIAVVEMVHHLVGLRPDITVRTFTDLGHWPSIEAPEVLGAALIDLIG